jgi:DNA-binding transcriptional LysR family regulator
VSLTGEGTRYLERCQRALLEFELLEAPSDARAELRGTLSITAPVLFGQLEIVPVVVAFLETHPALDVRLVLLDRIVSLADEGLDLGVRIGELPDSALRARLIGRVRSVLCASPDYLERAGTPRRLDALASHACIAFEPTTPIANRWAFKRGDERERSITVRPRLIVNTGQAAIDAAVLGLGIVRVLSYQVERLIAEHKLVTVLDSFASVPVPVHFVQLPGAPSRAATAFIELAAAKLRERL